MSGGHDNFDHLDVAGRVAASVAMRPRMVVYVLSSLAVLLSWIVLAALAARRVASQVPGVAGPGDGLAAMLPQLPLPAWLDSFFALCLTPAPPLETGVASFLALVAMWFLMSVAMMLPSAAPLVRTYCEIADTARKQNQSVVHPLVLVGGYLAVWIAASVGFAGLTMALQAAAEGGAVPGPAVGIAGAAALAIAGFYQFSALKEACLRKCRNPFSTLFARWTTRPAAVLRLGLEQGAWCVGCCWALMLVMFAVGTMNLFWMALIGIFTLVEKQVEGRFASQAAGTILLVWAAALLVVSRLVA